MTLQKIITGGQTGVDRAALDAALSAGISIGGWCPRGRLAEDGPIDAQYPLDETPEAAYAQRTAWNVRDSDGTLILTTDAPVGGTALTIEEATRHGRPWRHVRLPAPDAVATVHAWIEAQGIRVLNVAGPRASEAPGIYAAAYVFLQRLLTDT